MKEIKDKIGIGSLIALILVGAVVLVAIVKALNCCVPEASKFDVAIWGNVSEWFTFLVALIGGVFIYKTLDSQMKVQKDQNRIFKIEELKYLRSIRPEVNFKPSSNKKNWDIPYSNSWDNKLLSIFLTFNLTVDKDCSITYKIYTINKIFIEKHQNLIAGRIPIKITLKNIADENQPPIFENLLIEIHYIDKDKNEYQYTEELGIDYSPSNHSITYLKLSKSDELINTVY
ncbi:MULTISPECIES: hypothetical protein [Sphingobacterium]|uniref:hypothetical protein n=1 Tax=Sphingobacterium TaxID=28453 RepID=UPI0013DA61B4|nr:MULTISPECIES: hypothetical protein [unclassified Sphingobacterium]